MLLEHVAAGPVTFPLMTPVDEFRLKPPQGVQPDHERPDPHADAVRVAVYVCPTVAAGRLAASVQPRGVYSTAPISGCASRAFPFTSVDGAPAATPALIAGLPGSRSKTKPPG